MKTKDEIIAQVTTIFSSKWTSRDGTVVPEPETIGLGNDAVKFEGTVLYADMTDSTGLVDGYKDWFAAEVYKAYLFSACEVIRNNGGTITAFDGDRVMAVFIGGQKNSIAAKTGLQICATVRDLNRKLKERYPSSSFQLKQCVGIDTSPLFASRTGIRKYNDVVWVGSAANYAAKLCSIDSDGSSTLITERVYMKLSDASKFGGSPKQDMWEKTVWPDRGVPIYRTNWYWNF